MKKIISVVLALTLALCAFTSVSASYDITTDASDKAGVAFSNLVGDKFDENYFFLAEMTLDEDVIVDKDNSSKIEIVNKSNKDNIEIMLGAYVSNYNIAALVSQESITINAGDSWTYDAAKVSGYFIDTNDEGEKCATYGIALLNASSLTDDVSVELNIYEVQEEGEDNKFASAEYTFVGPVTFADEKLANFATVLTKIKQGKNVTADEIATALDEAATSTNLDNDAVDNKGAIQQLADKLNNNIIDKLGETLEKANIKVESATYDGLTVSMPYAGLADAVGEDEKVYAPIISEGNDSEYTCTGGEIKKALDISLGVNGAALAHKPLVAQKVIVDIPSSFDKNYQIFVYHNGVKENVEVSNNKAIFYTDSFSTFTLIGTPVVATENTRTTEATIKVAQDTENLDVFTISLVPESGKQIIKYATGGYTINVKSYDNTNTEESAMETFEYELTPANGMIITNEEYSEENAAYIGGITFVATAKDGDLITKGVNEELPLAKIKIKGTGDFSFHCKGLAADMNDKTDRKNMFYMETENDNDSIKAFIAPDNYQFTIPVKKYAVKFNVDFALELSDENATYANNADYIDIVITMTNNVTGEDYKVAIGENSTDPEIDKCIKVNYLDEKAVVSNVDITDEADMIKLPAGVTYSLKIEGKGFRTYRDSFHLDEDVTINLWNNALTSETREVVKNEASTAKKVTFLVGDIYEDGIVDIYDLSAVTAYYNTKNIEADSKYVAYDLDRNGAIDVQDIAWVQMSYGN